VNDRIYLVQGQHVFLKKRCWEREVLILEKSNDFQRHLNGALAESRGGILNGRAVEHSFVCTMPVVACCVSVFLFSG
jgi:phospholipid N-methyltransferase